MRREKARRGIFVTFEGGEGIGKSTQIELLVKRLKKNGFSVLKTREPGGTRVGEILRKIHKNLKVTPLAEVLILEASRAEHVQTKILPALKKRMIVVSDRYEESSLAYQGIVRGLGLPLIRKANRFATGGLRADRIYLLDGKRRMTERRSKKDRFDHENAAFHKKVRMAYLRLARSDRRFYVLNADTDRLTLHEQIMDDLLTLIKKRRSK